MPFWGKFTEWHRMIWTLQGQRHPIYVLQDIVLMGPKFKSVSLYEQPFWRYRPILTQEDRMTPKWPWTLKGQRYYYYLYVLLVPMIPNSSPFCSTTSRFGIAGHFETSAQNDLKMTLDTRSKVAHICFTTVPESQIQFVSLYDQLFSRYKVVDNRKNRKCTEGPQTDFEQSNVHHIPHRHHVTNPEAQILVRFALRSAVFKI